MKPIPIKINGIQFRSKLEARWYLFMKKLQWRIEYEPQELPEINGWIPDFMIIGKDRKILVDVKPIYLMEEWSPHHVDYNKILNSGIRNTKYELLITGASFGLGGSSAFGILYEHNDLYDDYFISVKSKVKSNSANRYPVVTVENNIVNCFTGKIQGIYIIEDYINEIINR
jgi:hypothetical protein